MIFKWHKLRINPTSSRVPLSRSLLSLLSQGVFTERTDNQSAVSRLQRLAVSVRQFWRGPWGGGGSGGIGGHLRIHLSHTIQSEGAEVRKKLQGQVVT